MVKTLIADLEADNLLPEITKLWQLSIMDADDEAEQVDSYHDQPGRKAGTIMDGIQRLLDADVTVWHNGLQYDLPAIEIVYGIQLDPHKVIDTLVLSRLGRPERQGGHALEAWGERFGVPKPIHEDWTRWSRAMEHRCGEDVKITKQLFERLAPMLTHMPDAVYAEHRVAWQCGLMMREGFPLDEPYVRTHVGRLLKEQEEILDDLHKVFRPILVPPEASPAKRVRSLKVVNSRHPLHGQLDPGVEYCPVVVQEFNPGSTQQVAYRLQTRYDWKPRAFTPTGLPEVSETTLSGLEYPEAKVFLRYLANQKNLGFMAGEPRPNGGGGGWLHHSRGHADGTTRVHAYINTCKAVTGRPSCSSPNLQQVPTDDWLRRSFLPLPGHVLTGVDASGLELRCLGHYLARLDGGQYANEVVEGDIHTKVMHLIGFDHGDPKIGRNNTKRFEYATLYGAGNAKLGMIAKENYYEQTGKVLKGNPGRIGGELRRRMEGGLAGYKDLTSQVKAKVKSDGRLKGLDGRTLWARSQHSALNLLIQSAGIIIIKHAMALAPEYLGTAGYTWGREYTPLMWVHDEWQVSCLPEFAEDIGRLLSETFGIAGERLGVRCQLDGEYKIGSHWGETH